MRVIKKYGNRRLYDTELSRYVTLEELTQTIRDGEEVHVVDAKSGAELTQATLTQIIVESRHAGALLPSAVLHQLVRLENDALAEFLGRYVQGALELYLQAKKGAQTFMPFNPYAAFSPFGAQAWPGWGLSPSPSAAPPAQPPPQPSAADVDALRRELAELKGSLRRRRKTR